MGAGFEVDFIALRRENDPAEEMARGVRVLHVNQQRYRGRGLFQYMLACLNFFVRRFFKLLLWREKLSAWYSDRVLTVHDPVKDLILVKNKDKMAVKITGEGDFSDELKRLISDSKLEGFVQFDNRFYPMRDIPRIISDANIGLVPLEISSITNYTLPLKMLEYISLGLPVITVRNAAISCYFDENDCFYYQPGDSESLRAVLDRVAEDASLLMRYHQRAVMLREKFCWSSEKKKHISLLQRFSQ